MKNSLTAELSENSAKGAGEKSIGPQNGDRKGAGEKDAGRQNGDRKGAGEKGASRQNVDRKGAGGKGASRQNGDRKGAGEKGVSRQNGDRKGAGEKSPSRKEASKGTDRPVIGKKTMGILFFIYLLVVIKLIIFKYPYDQLKAIADTWEKGVILEGLDTANFTLFKTIRMYIDYSYMLNSFENLVGNVVVFIPFGFLIPYVLRRGRNFLVMLSNAFLFVLGIEVFQLFSAFGAFDVDDILLNCFGAVIGYFLYLLWEKIKKHLFEREGRKRNV